MTAVLRSPLLHFLVLGWVASAWITADQPAAAQVRDASEEEVLYREAVRRGFAQLPVVEQRLHALTSFLGLAQGGAESLGLRDEDPVIRRYLVEAAREHLRAELEIPEPTAAEIATHLTARPEFSRAAPRTRISHAFIGGFDRRDLALALTTKLNEGEMGLAEVIASGDAFLGGHDLPLLQERELSARFGRSFAARVAALPPGAAPQPIASVYGHHVVWVHDRRSLPVDRTRRARHELLSARTERALARKISALSGGS